MASSATISYILNEIQQGRMTQQRGEELAQKMGENLPADSLTIDATVQPTASVNNEPGVIVHEPAADTDDSIIDLDAAAPQASRTEQIEAPSAMNNDTPEAQLEKVQAQLEAEKTKNKLLEDAKESLEEDYDKLQQEAGQTKDELLKHTEDVKARGGLPSFETVTTRLDLVESKRIEWLWNGRIPMGKLTVLTGNPDQGKSLVSLYIVSQVTLGLPMFQDTEALTRGDVLLMAAEDDTADTIRPRLEAMGASLMRIHILESVVVRDGKGKSISDRGAQLDTDLQAIENFLKKNDGVRLIVIDPISSFLGRANMNREQEVRGVLTPLRNLAEKYHVAIIAVMHLNKNSDASAIHRIGGAMAFAGVARAAWLFTEDPEDKTRHLMLRIKNNIAKAIGGLVYTIKAVPLLIDGVEVEQPYIEWLGAVDKTAQDVLIAGAPVGRPAEKITSAKEWLADFLANGEQTTSDVKSFGKKNGHCWASLRRAKNGLGVIAEQHDRQWYWRSSTSAPMEGSIINLDSDAQN